MNSNSNVTIDTLFDKVISHAYKTAYHNNRSLNGYLLDIGFRASTFHDLRRRHIPQRQKFALFLTLLADYLNTHQIKL